MFAMRSESPSIAGTSTSTSTRTSTLEHTAHTLGPLYADSLSPRSPLSSSTPLPCQVSSMWLHPFSCHQIGKEREREKKKFCYRVEPAHTLLKLLNTLTCHGQPPADLAIWGSSQLC